MTAALASLACPVCRSPFDTHADGLRCSGCGQTFRAADGVEVLVPNPDEAAKSFYAVEEAGRFGRDANSMGESFARPVREFLDALPRDWTVVEIGAGQGAFDGAHPGYIATDYSFFALREYSSGHRIQADAQALPFADESVDAFFSVATFEHIPDPARAAAELNRCLKPGGRLLLFPAWYVRPWAATALAVRPYSDLSWPDRLRKAVIPLRNGKPYQFARVLPGRLRRELALRLGRRVPFQYRRLTPNLSEYVTTDSDAFASLDPQAVASYFVSLGYADRRRPRGIARILYGFEPVLVDKPPSTTT
jgi:SAM-dependent methyltransferase